MIGWARLSKTKSKDLLAGGRSAIISQLGAWFLLAIIGQVFLLSGQARETEAAYLVHAAFLDGSPYVVVGIGAALVAQTTSLIARYSLPLERTFAMILFFLLAYWALTEDLGGLIHRLEESYGELPWYPMLCFLPAIALLVETHIVRHLCRLGIGWLALAGGAIVAGANHLVLYQGYPGIHLLIGIGAALAMSGGIAGWAERVAFRFTRMQFLSVSLMLTLPSLAGVLSQKDEAIWSHRQQFSGAFLVPYFPIRMSASAEELALYGGSEWFQDRSEADELAPTQTRPVPSPEVVILLGIDALRADVVESARYDELLPHLARLREESLNFTEARSTASSTASTLYSIFTGRYYSQTYWSRRDDNRKKLKRGQDIFPFFDETITLAQLLSAAEISTTHVATMRSITGRRGIDRGFERVVRTKHYGSAAKAMRKILHEVRKKDQGKLFLFCHFIDAHAPYNRGGKKGSQYERYLKEVAVIDHELGKLLKFLKKGKRFERTLLIVTADHGEAFGEHGTRFHAATVYDELLRVPLLFWGAAVPAVRVDTPVSLIDLAPTVLDLFDQPTPGAMMGESLVPALLGETLELTRPIVFDSSRRSQGMLFPDGSKLVMNLKKKTRELYDLETDPGEEQNIVAEPGAHGSEKVATLKAFFSTHRLKREGYKPPARRF